MAGPQLKFRHWLPVLLIAGGLATLPLFMVLDRHPVADIAHVKRTGKLRVLTIEGPTTYYRTPDGPSGFEYDLLNAFAKKLGVRLELDVADSLASIFPRLLRGDANFAAAALNVTPAREQIVRFSMPYETINTRVIYRLGDPRPQGLQDLVGRRVVVPAGSVYAQFLRASRAAHPGLRWSETSSETPEDLLDDVWERNIDVTFSPSNLFTIVRQYQPDLRIGFSLPSKSQLAWAFRPDGDDTLVRAANDFLEEMRRSGELARLIDRYYGPASKFDYVNVKTFRQRIGAVLPRYEQLFKRAAAENDLDWRLLAAQSYQESYWEPGAVSPTGVRGLMQLTEATASLIEVKDRSDPRQSVLGGARYLHSIVQRIDGSAPEPDRTWLALAAYNVGLGHLLDAQRLAREQHKNPDQWADVKTTLPLLTDPEWYKKTKHGFARGNEAVAYVTRIRTFFDILARLEPDPLKANDMKMDVPAL
ncbi:MAG: membrane-bound lytic murein transglycosylase MltF [Arenicellales bacterium]